MDAFGAVLHKPGHAPEVVFAGSLESCQRYVELRLAKHRKGAAAGDVEQVGPREWLLRENAQTLSLLPWYGTLRIVPQRELARAGIQVEAVDEDQHWEDRKERKITPVILLPAALNQRRR